MRRLPVAPLPRGSPARLLVPHASPCKFPKPKFLKQHVRCERKLVEAELATTVSDEANILVLDLLKLNSTTIRLNKLSAEVNLLKWTLLTNTYVKAEVANVKLVKAGIAKAKPANAKCAKARVAESKSAKATFVSTTFA